MASLSAPPPGPPAPSPALSIVLPAKNEAIALPPVLARLVALFPTAEILVVDDGSTDDTGAVARAHGARVVRHPRSRGNGAAIKTGARNARGATLVFMDADGQHRPEDIPLLLARLDAGDDMAVAQRTRGAQASVFRMGANGLYNRLASFLTEQPIGDLTSGFRAVRAEIFRRYLPILPNSFSYPTTITMAMIRSGYGVAYVPIDVQDRHAGTQSHVRLLRDGARFFLIIFKIATLFSPLKLFSLVAASTFLTGLAYYAYTYVTTNRFTNMGLLLMIVSVVLFMVGLISEQVSQVLFATLEGPTEKARARAPDDASTPDPS